MTLEALLVPSVLARLGSHDEYRFCEEADCDVVYFSFSRRFVGADVRVGVHQKDVGAATPVCYCLGLTRGRVEQAAADGTSAALLDSVRALVRAGRCECEVTNPQGRCCLGNVTRLVRDANVDPSTSAAAEGLQPQVGRRP